MKETTSEPSLGRKHSAWRMVGVGVLVLVLLADQASKQWILQGLKFQEGDSMALAPFLNFTLVWNHAVTFGMFAGHAPWLFVALSLSAVLGLLVVLLRSQRRLVSIACGAIMGGALGNVIDRIHYGAVVDFLHFHVAGWSWYVFNVADSAIVCGVGFWLLDSFLADRRDNRS